MPELRPISARFTPDLGEVAKRLVPVGKRLVDLVESGLERNAALMAEELRRTTPRSKSPDVVIAALDLGPPDGHVADGWKHKRVDALYGEFAVEVYNDHPRANEELKAGGGTTTLLHILEYGSVAHTIVPVNAPYLVFFWPAIGGIVHARSVEHPGTKPHAMVAEATEGAVERGTALVEAAVRVAGQLAAGA